MAEAAGLAIGVAALFNTCIDSFKIIFAAQEFARDFEILDTRFQQQRLRLLIWGQSVGIISRQGAMPRPYLQELDTDHVKPTVIRSLGSINCLLEQFKVLESRYGLKNDTTTGPLNISISRRASFKEFIRSNQNQKSPRALAKWAVFDADQMRSAVEQLNSLIDGLVNITNELRNIRKENHGISMTMCPSAGNNFPRNISTLSEVPTISAPSQQLLALDLQISTETFHTAQELIDSIETFTTAPNTAGKSTAFFTAEELLPMSIEQNDSDERDRIQDLGTAATTFDLPIRPALLPLSHLTMPCDSNVHSSTPQTYAMHFPTDRRILITHETEAIDGNMNLRMCVQVPHEDDKASYISLFHFQMHKLRQRNFSFKRYGRERRNPHEICGTHLSQDNEASAKRHGSMSQLSRSFTRLHQKTKNSFDSMQQFARGSVETLHMSKLSFSSSRSSISSLSSNVSGVSSQQNNDMAQELEETVRDVVVEQLLNKTIQLVFTNYARIELKRKGRKRLKRYTFSYWGRDYHWQRTVDQTWKTTSDCYGHSFHLFCAGQKDALAHIEPIVGAAVSSTEWVPACELRFTNPTLHTSEHSLYEALIATGVVALVDNAIRSYLAVIETGEAGLPELIMRK